jgi:hypothetical protein
MNQETIESVYKAAREKTAIKFDETNSIFKPKLASFHHLDAGHSKVKTNPFALILEWFFFVYSRICDWFAGVKNRLFPRRDVFYGAHLDSSIVGRIIHEKKNGIETPIHNLRLEFWGRTRLFQWRKLGAGRTDNNGYFEIEFDLLAARSRSLRKNLRFEIFQVSRTYHGEDQVVPVVQLFKTIKIPKSNLIGLSYNLRTIQLNFWEYRDDTRLPRVLIKDHDKDAPQYYTKKRVEAMGLQFIPIELIKRKHLRMIKRGSPKINLAKIQSDYPENLTTVMESLHPGITRSDAWFGIRMMNGMNMATFIPDQKDNRYYWVKYFGSGPYDVNTDYAFPTSEIKFELNGHGLPMPIEIILTGPLNAYNKDPWQQRVFRPTDGALWEAAKRVCRVNGALCTELDEHLTATHLNTEQYAIAAWRNLHLSPLSYLLFPHLKEVVLVNHTADKILIHDYLPAATALTLNGITHRAQHILGLMDWKGWYPMIPISEAHSYAKAEDLYWQVVTEYVDHFFEIHLQDIKKWWYEVYMFSQDLVEHAVPLFHSDWNMDLLSPEAREMELKRREYFSLQYRINLNQPRSVVNGEVRAVSPITQSKIFDPEKPEEIQNLKDVCKYIIMISTFLHTWANEHQYDDIGEVLYSCLGLRFGDKPEGVLAPESDLGIAPDLTRTTQMMWFSNFLSRTEYGFITRNEDVDIDPHFSKMLMDRKDAFEKLGVDINSIESRTNI